jgi:SAM-dependent methyltransferase
LSRGPDLGVVARSLAAHRAQLEAFTRAATTLIVREVSNATRVVDLASGTGDPALALAAAHPGARVLATDLVPEFLQQATEEARVRQLPNFGALCSAMHALPLPAASVDAVTSRFGVQFAQQVDRVFDDIQRVLEPGGLTCPVAWGAADQPLLRTLLGEQPRFAVGAPGPFQFSSSGSLARALTAAGFVEVQEHTHRSEWVWDGDPHSFWQFMRDTSGDALAADTAAVVANLKAFERHNTLVFPVEVHCGRARKRCNA